MRFLILALACLLAAPAAAQTPPADSAQAVRNLSAMWRPLTESMSQGSVERACAGALEEIEAVESALPRVLTPASLRRVRALRGILIVPADEPNTAFFFPDASMPWFASGQGLVGVLDTGEGFVGVRDAAGQNIAIQLGTGGGRPMMRIQQPGTTTILNFVGCAPTADR